MSANKASQSQPEPFIFTCDEAVPRNATRVRVDPRVNVIPREAFAYRVNLIEVELCEGLLIIEKDAFTGCRSLKGSPAKEPAADGTSVRSGWGVWELVIPSTVQEIFEGAFSHCWDLEGVSILSKKMNEMKACTFSGCRSLRRVNIPSTVRNIAHHAFRATLAPLDLPDGVETIEYAAFNECKFRHVRVPPLVAVIGRSSFYSCRRMVSAEIPEGISLIERFAFMRCDSLRNAAIPPNADLGRQGCFSDCRDLIQLFGSNEGIKEALIGRFEGLPIHKICYYHSYRDTETTIKLLEAFVATDSACGGSDQDCLGMTPFHILACSKKQDIKLYEWLMQCPKYLNLITKDRWGCVPIFYALLTDAPSEVLKFLLNCHTDLFSTSILDVEKMTGDLSRYGAPLGNIKLLLGMQHKFFPVESVDWEQFVSAMAASDDAILVPIETFRYLVHFSLSKRVRNIGIKQWRAAFYDETEKIGNLGRKASLEAIKIMLSIVENAYHELKEATSALELVLWKGKFNETKLIYRCCGEKRRNKRLRMGKAGFLRQCRIGCGAEVVVKGVLPFLIEKMSLAVLKERCLRQTNEVCNACERVVE